MLVASLFFASSLFMEKELLEAIRTTEKVVEVATTNGRLTNEDGYADSLNRIRNLLITTKDLVATQVFPWSLQPIADSHLI